MGVTVKEIFTKIDLGEEVTKYDIETLIKDDNVFDKYNIMKDLLKILKKRRVYLIQQKHLYEKTENIPEKEIIKSKIKGIKKVEELLRIEINNLVFQEKESDSGKERLPVFLRMQISNLNDIRCMQYLFDEEMVCLLNELEEESLTDKKLLLIEELVSRFEAILKELQGKLDSIIETLLSEVKKNGEYKLNLKKKSIKTFLRDEKYETFKLNMDYYDVSIKGVKSILERLYTLKGIQKSAILKEQKIVERKNTDIFVNDTQDIINMILDGSNLDMSLMEKMKKVSATFLKCLNSSKIEIDCDSLEEYTDFFVFMFQFMKNEDIICLCNIFRNCLKSKCYELKGLEVDTSSTRKRLKQIMKLYNEEKKEVFNTIVEDRKEIYTNIFTSLLDDELNYYYFSRILEEVKLDLNSFEIKKLLEQIVDRFIVNYKYKLANQNFSYVDPKYYESLLILFVNNDLMTSEFKNIIMNRLEEFKTYLCKKEGNISQPKSEALKDIEDLSLKLDGLIETKDNYSYLSKKISNMIKEKIPYIVLNHQRLGFSSGDKENYKDYDYSTFVIGKYAYSKRYNDEGDFFFQVHILDTSSFITENEGIDDYIKSSTLNKNDISFKYEEGKKYPVMTFQFRIYQNNTVSQMKLFSNIIEIDSIYSLNDLTNYRDNVDLKALVSAHKRIGDFCLEGFDIDENTDALLSSHLIEFLNGFEKEIPMMYRRDCGKAFQVLNVRNHNQICYYLSKVPKKQAHKIFHILDEKPEDIYTNYQTDDAYISMDSFSYSGIYLLRTIKRLIKGDYSFHEDEYDREKAQVISYCKNLNKQYGYVPDKIMKQDKVKNIDKR